MRSLAAAALLLLGASCEARPEDRLDTTFDGSAGVVEVVVLGDGFVRTGSRRIPLELFVLEQRRITRAMSAEERGRYVVQVRLGEGLDDGAAALAAQRGLNRLIDELDIMDVGQVRLL